MECGFADGQVVPGKCGGNVKLHLVGCPGGVAIWCWEMELVEEVGSVCGYVCLEVLKCVGLEGVCLSLWLGKLGSCDVDRGEECE